MSSRDGLVDRLRKGLLANGIRQTDIAVRLRVTRQSVHQIMTGKSAGHDHLPTLAEILGTTVEWLVNGTGSAPSWAGGESPRPVIVTGGQGLHVVGVVSAGDGETNGDPYAASRDPFPIPESWDVVQVQGGSAYPVAYNGQFAIIDTARAATPATLDDDSIADLDDNMVLIQTNEDGKLRAYLKRFCAESRSPCRYTLASVNSGHRSPYLPPEVIEVITPVVGVVFEDPRLPRVKGRVRTPTIDNMGK